MKVQTFKYYQDPTGGWIEVPRKLIDSLLIEAEISSLSRVSGALVYLHEDRDASVFVAAMRRTGEVVKTNQTWSQDCWVRGLDRYPENLNLFGRADVPKVVHRQPVQVSLF